jgi:hypothetical protein
MPELQQDVREALGKCSCSFEHLGVLVDTEQGTAEVPPKAVDEAVATCRRLRVVPVPHPLRELLVTATVVSKVAWPAGLVNTWACDSFGLTREARLAITRNRATWSCAARTWVLTTRMHSAHPKWAAVLRGIARLGAGRGAEDFARPPTVALARGSRATLHPWRRLQCHLRQLGWIAGPEAGEATTADDQLVLLASDGAPHALREAARRKMLEKVCQSRFDSDGAENIDVEASAHLLRHGALSTANRSLLCTVLQGGLSSFTRRWYGRDDARAQCPLCNTSYGSVRHLAWECPSLAHLRFRLPGGRDPETLPGCSLSAGAVNTDGATRTGRGFATHSACCC